MTKSIKLPLPRLLRSIAPTSFTELRECVLKSVWRLRNYLKTLHRLQTVIPAKAGIQRI